MKENHNKLELIPRLEKYIQYILEMLIKIPRTEKFSIGNEYKSSMYKTMEYVKEIIGINRILAIRTIFR